MKEFPKVLICAPTASAKNYCFEQWLDNVMNFNYPNYEIRLFDNTYKDGGEFTNKMNSIFETKYGKGNNKFYAFNSAKINNIKSDAVGSVISRMTMSHNDCREYAIKYGYQFMFHLETDVFPPANVIEELMSKNKQVIGGLYDIDEGKWRRLMVQKHIWSAPQVVDSVNVKAGYDAYFVDGNVKEVSSVGLGCVLIHSTVFKKIPFRFVEGEQNHPDSFFSEDCFRKGIKIYADTSIYCRHDNRAWGIYGKDFY
jgi:hypothetical protein